MMSVAIVDSATFQLVARRERGQCQPDHLAARVAHEYGGGLPRPEVEREKAGDGERKCERDHEQKVVVVDPDGIDREEDRRHDGEAPGEAVHVVEEVEGVRHRHEPQEAEGRGGNAVVDDLHADPRCEHDARGAELPG